MPSGRKPSLYTFVRKAGADGVLYKPVEIPFGDVPAALIVFTTEKKALPYLRKAGLPEKWDLFKEDKEFFADLLEDYKYIVVNPLPDGNKGQLLTHFQTLVELC